MDTVGTNRDRFMNPKIHSHTPDRHARVPPSKKKKIVALRGVIHVPATGGTGESLWFFGATKTTHRIFLFNYITFPKANDDGFRDLNARELQLRDLGFQTQL